MGVNKTCNSLFLILNPFFKDFKVQWLVVLPVLPSYSSHTNKEWWLYPLAMYPCPIITCHLCNCPPTVPLGIHPIMKHNGFLGYQENGQCEGWLQLLAMNKWLAGQKNPGTELQRLVEIQILDSAVFRNGQKSAINDVCVKTPNCQQGASYYQTLKLSSALATAVTEIKGKNQSCKRHILQKQASP